MSLFNYYFKRLGVIALMMAILTLLIMFIFTDNIVYYSAIVAFMIFQAMLMSIMVQGDLHHSERLTFLSSLPIKRSSYYVQNFSVGLLFTLIPVVICLFNKIPWTMIIATIMAYSLFYLAGCLTGNSIIHLLLGLLFVALPFLITNMIASMMKISYYGLVMNNAFKYYGVLNYIAESSTHTMVFIDIAVIIISIFLSFFAFLKASRLHSDDNILFSGVRIVLVYFTSFILTYYFVLMSAHAKAKGEIHGLPFGLFLIVSLIAGTAIFIIIQMIASSSIHIFNRQTMKSFIIYVIFYALLSSVTFYDSLGIASRQLPASQIASIRIHAPFLKNGVTIKEEDNIDRLLTIQKSIIAHRFVSQDYDGELQYSIQLKNGQKQVRTYDMNYTDRYTYKDYVALFNSVEMHKQNQLNLTALEKQNAMLEVTTTTRPVNYDTKETIMILKAYNKDLAHLTYSQLIDTMDQEALKITTKNKEDIYLSLNHDYRYTLKEMKKDPGKYNAIKATLA